MKKLSIILALLMFLTAVSSSFAENLLPSTRVNKEASRSALKTQTEATRLESLKERANTEITRRIDFLTELSEKINDIKKLSDADKANLKGQIQAQIDGLSALKIKINADTDLATLKTDVKSIVSGYYIFAFFRVKISLYVALGRMSTATDTLNTVYTKLQARISEQESNGADVTSLNILLSDMLVKINDAKVQYEAAMAILNSLDAQGFPGNKSSLLDARAKSKLGAEDLRAAYKDAIKIRQGLGDITGNLRKGIFEKRESTKSSETN